jgi:uncharacterized protein YjiS (DUF1127 family)
MKQVHGLSASGCASVTAGRIPQYHASREGLFARILSVALTWQDRAVQRTQLASMDDRLLRDMGIDPLEARMEAEKPFWKA